MRPDNSPLQTLLAALPDARLAALVLELASRLSGGNGPQTAPAGAMAGAAQVVPAATATTKTASPADPRTAMLSPSAMLAARRARKNQARAARRAAARQAKAGDVETAATSKATNGAAAASAPDPGTPAPQQPKRPQGWPKGRKRGPRKVTTGQPVQARTGNKAGNGAVHAPAPAGTATTPAARLWARAATLAPTTPWRVVAREFGTNEAQAQDACRTGTLPPGIAPAAIEPFLEARPAA